MAPIAGYVGLIEPQAGDLVTPTTTITRIEDRSALIVDFRVPEAAAARVAVGDALRVQALIENTDDRLRAGMAFEITLSFSGDSYPAVDPRAIQWRAEGAFVWVVRDAVALRPKADVTVTAPRS